MFSREKRCHICVKSLILTTNKLNKKGCGIMCEQCRQQLENSLKDKNITYNTIQTILDRGIEELEKLKFTLNIEELCKENGLSKATTEELLKVFELLEQLDVMKKLLEKHKL